MTVTDSEDGGRYRLLFDHMLDGLAYCQMIVDDQKKPVDFVYLEVNPSFGRLTGLTNVVGKKVTEVIPGIKETNPELFEIYGGVAENGIPRKFETYIPTLNIWFSVSVYSPKRGYFVAVFNNITDQKLALKKAEESLLAVSVQEAKLAAIANWIADGVFAVDIKGSIIMFNRAAAKITSYSAEEVMGKPYWEVLSFSPAGLGQTGSDFIRESLTGKREEVKGSYLVTTKGGGHIPVAVVSSPTFDQGGRFMGVVVIFRLAS